MSRSGGGDDVDTGACISGEFRLWLQPAELTDHSCDVYTWRCKGYRTGCTVLTLIDISGLRSEENQRSDSRQKSTANINIIFLYKKAQPCWHI